MNMHPLLHHARLWPLVIGCLFLTGETQAVHQERKTADYAVNVIRQLYIAEQHYMGLNGHYTKDLNALSSHIDFDDLQYGFHIVFCSNLSCAAIRRSTDEFRYELLVFFGDYYNDFETDKIRCLDLNIEAPEDFKPKYNRHGKDFPYGFGTGICAEMGFGGDGWVDED